jgi:hypothetical protein
MKSKPLVEIDVLDNLSWSDFAEIVNQIVHFEEADVEDEMMRQGTIYSYYYGLMSVAKKDMDEAAGSRDRLASVIRREARENNRGKKLTAKDLDDLVVESQEVFDAEQELIQATLKYDMLKGLVRALEHKRDMLVQCSSNRRAETKLYQ